MGVSLKFEFKRQEKIVCGENGASREGYIMPRVM